MISQVIILQFLTSFFWLVLSVFQTQLVIVALFDLDPAIPPLLLVLSQVIGYIKGKSAIYIARRYRGKTRNFMGENFWARGYFVSTVGRDEEAVRNYIKEQQKEDQRIEQLKLFE